MVKILATDTPIFFSNRLLHSILTSTMWSTQIPGKHMKFSGRQYLRIINEWRAKITVISNKVGGLEGVTDKCEYLTTYW